MKYHIYIARIILECQTPLSISTGTPDNVFDTALVRDANGLPAIPGSSLAGVLRHLYQKLYGQESTDELFGYQKQKEKQNGKASELQFSWGHLIDSQGRVAEGLIFDQNRLNDPLFQSVLAQIDEPVFRDRVRINRRGSAVNQGKFDRVVLPAGHRFAFEIMLISKKRDEDWYRLLDLLVHPEFRLGGNTRSGLGKMKLVQIYQASFNMKESNPSESDTELNRFNRVERALDSTVGLSEYQPRPYTGGLTACLTLEAIDFWRIGSGYQPLTSGDKPADLLPLLEEKIQWSDGKGERQTRFALLPASSLKGALAHRILFHLNRLKGQWADSKEQDLEEFHALMGKEKGPDDSGQAGALFIDDAYLEIPKEQLKEQLEKQVARLMHNAIDRFSGGVLEHALFEEESLFQSEINIDIYLDPSRIESQQNDQKALIKKALRAAFDDLIQGRLGLGSRTTTGHGFFKGKINGPLVDWLEKTE